MRSAEGDRLPDVLAALGALVLLGGLVLTLVTGAGDAPGRIILLGVGGILCAVALGLVLRRGGGLAAARAAAEERAAEAEQRAEAAEERAAEAEQRAETADGRARRAEEQQQRALAARTRAERARAVEREWNRELRDQLSRLYHERRSLAETDDVHALVLQTAIALLEAEKGVLLARRDADGDGRLDLVAAAGFREDPERSSTVQRFARAVDDHERIIHEDAADDPEIENLVAIPVWIADDFAGVVVCANRDGGFADHDDELLLALGGHAGAALDSAHLQADLRASYLGSIRMLTEAIEAKDTSLRRHVEHVAGAALAVGERLGLDGAERERLLFGSLLHDVGKIGIAEQILAKPGGLTPEERRIVELHPRIGARLVEQVPALREVARCVLHHHERFDGAGYPSGLRGEEIPVLARIVGVADAFAAMTAERPYQAAMDAGAACAELERCAGSQFDPEVVALFVEEVRGQEDPSRPAALTEALADPELAARRGDGLVGAGVAAFVDPLTLLYSRRYFDETLLARAGAAALRQEPFALVLVALADLGQLNRAEGLAAGDAALATVAAAVQDLAARGDGLACRFSGRRFAVLLPRGGVETADALADLRAGLSGAAGARCAAATWQPGDSAADVVARAARELRSVAAP